MLKLRRGHFSWLLCGLAALWGAPNPAHAFTSVEAASIGDQGFYWSTPAEVWLFPQRLANIDNRAALQTELKLTTEVFNPETGAFETKRVAPRLFNILPVQQHRGVGVSLEVDDGMHLGLWVTDGYAPAIGTDFDPTLGGVGLRESESFMDRAVRRTGWGTFVGYSPTVPDGYDDIQNVDPLDTAQTGGQIEPYNLTGPLTVDARRKLDLFFSYLIPELDLDTGVRINWGSGHLNLTQDDSIGPINTLTDSNGETSPGAGDGDPNPAGNPRNTARRVGEGKLSFSDLGVSLGAGWTGIEGLRADASVDVNLLGADLRPNGQDGFLDAGGLGLGFNVRAHYALDDEWTFGGFFRYQRQSLGFEPKRQRDGGELPPMDTASRSDTSSPRYGGNLGDPATRFGDTVDSDGDGDPIDPGEFDPTNTNPDRDGDGTPDSPAAPDAHPSDPAFPRNEYFPVAGMRYEETTSVLQLAGLARYTPVSRATLYAALGFEARGEVDELTAPSAQGKDAFLLKEERQYRTLPFVHVGLVGSVVSHWDLMLGAVKRWSGLTDTGTGRDARIPNNGDGAGTTGTPPLASDQGATNAARRFKTESYSADTTEESVTVGTRLYWGGFQLVGQVQLDFLTNGPHFVSGNTTHGGVFTWLALIYDWDHDEDEAGGNGTLRAAPKNAL